MAVQFPCGREFKYVNRPEPKSSRIKVRACKLGCKAVEGDKAYKEENLVEGEVAEVFRGLYGAFICYKFEGNKACHGSN